MYIELSCKTKEFFLKHIYIHIIIILFISSIQLTLGSSIDLSDIDIIVNITDIDKNVSSSFKESGNISKEIPKAVYLWLITISANEDLWAAHKKIEVLPDLSWEAEVNIGDRPRVEEKFSTAIVLVDKECDKHLANEKRTKGNNGFLALSKDYNYIISKKAERIRVT